MNEDFIAKAFPQAAFMDASVKDGTFPKVVKFVGAIRCGQSLYAEYVSKVCGYEKLMKFSGFQFGIRTDQRIEEVLSGNNSMYVSLSLRTADFFFSTLPPLADRHVFMDFDYETTFSCMEIRFSQMDRKQMKEVIDTIPKSAMKFTASADILDAIYEYSKGHLDTVMDFIYSLPYKYSRSDVLTALSGRTKTYDKFYTILIDPEVPFSEVQDMLKSMVEKENIVDMHRHLKSVLANDLIQHRQNLQSTGIYNLLMADFSYSNAAMIGGWLEIAGIIRG